MMKVPPGIHTMSSKGASLGGEDFSRLSNFFFDAAMLTNLFIDRSLR
jgi:hypothetical protein